MPNLEDARGSKRIISTGRGGAGNLIRSPSRIVDPEVVPGAERGREIAPRDVSGNRVTHSGRGGAGNIRSPFRNRADIVAEEKEAALLDRLVAQARGRQADQPSSTGRGGVGNIRRKGKSRSAIRGTTPSEGRNTPSSPGHTHHEVHSSRWGGWGNIAEDKERDSVDEAKEAAERQYEADVTAKHHAAEANAPHSIGKGGAINIGHVAVPVDLSKLSLEEREAYAKVHARDRANGISGGRGGAGNIHTPKELSPADGELCRGDHKHGVLGSVLRSLSRAAGRDRSSDHKSDAPSPLTLHLLGDDTSSLSFSGSVSRSTPPLAIVITDMDLDPYEGVDPCSFSRRAPSVHRPRRSIDGLEEGSLDSFPFPPPRNLAEERLKSPTPSCISWPVSVSHSDISLEVASALVRTDFNDDVSFNDALEVFKRYVRAKIKKGTGKEVDSPGGKLEALEVKDAHLGFQDGFYLGRLRRSLSSSALTLPGPTSPIRRQPLNACPPEYQVSLEDARESISEGSSIGTASTGLRRQISRGRDSSVECFNQTVSSVAPTLPTPSLGSFDLGSFTLTLPVRAPVRAPAPPSPAVLIPQREVQPDGRDHFDHVVTSPVTPLHLAEPAEAGVPASAGSRPGHVTRMASGSSTGSGGPGQHGQQQRTAQKMASVDDMGVKRMLEARIKALQSALNSLAVDQSMPIPTSAPMARPRSSGSSTRRDLPARAPPPIAPLPPLPGHAPDYFAQSPRRAQPEQLRVQNPSTPVSSAAPSPTITRASSITKRLLPVPHVSQSNISPRSTSSNGTLPSHSPTLMFELEPESGLDPFARSVGAAVWSRYERKAAAYVRAGEDLRRVKLEMDEGRETTPPRYEAGLHGRAI